MTGYGTAGRDSRQEVLPHTANFAVQPITAGFSVAFPEWYAARYQVQLVQGSTVFLVADDPPLLASLIRVADRVWNLEQLCGPKNAAPPPSMRTALICGLAAAGQKIVMTDPQSALGRLTQEGNHRRGVVEDDLEDEDDVAEGEIAA